MDSSDYMTTGRLSGNARSTRDLRIAVIILVTATWVMITRQWGHWSEDLSAVYIAGWLWQNGQTELLYAAPPGFFGGPADSWLPIIERLGGADELTFPFVYPPLWAVLAAPATQVTGFVTFSNYVSLLQFPVLAGSVLLAARLFRPAQMPLWLWSAIGAALLLLSVPSYIAMGLNQPSITVTFLVLLSFERVQSGRPVAAGVALAVAAALKLTPAAFAVIFLIDRQYRALAIFAIAGAALGLLSIALAGPELHWGFLDTLHEIKGTALLSGVNISLLPALIALGSALGLSGALDTSEPILILHGVPAWLGPTLALAALIYAFLVLRALRSWPRPEARVMGILAISILIPLCGPLGWQHYYLVPLLLVPGFVFRLPARVAILLTVALAVPTLKPSARLLAELPWPLASYVWAASVAWLAVLAALIAVVRHRNP